MHNRTKIRLYRILLRITWIPSVLLLWIPAQLAPRFNGRYFFLFDRYALGGAQRVHLDILASLANKNKRVWFTRLSLNSVLKSTFYDQPNTRSSDIHRWCDNLVFRLFTVHWMAFYLNRHRGAQVFSSNSTFFYDLLPFLSKHLRTTELLHNFTYGRNGMEWFGLFNHRYLSQRLTVDFSTLANIKRQYHEWNIAPEWEARLGIIEPGVRVPADEESGLKAPAPPLHVLYAGRGGPQKRVWLIDRIAQAAYNTGLPVQFHFAGDIADELSPDVKTAAVLHGMVSKEADMYRIYTASHVLLMTSAYEGFPMAIKEAMACRCIPVVTALEGNKTHLRAGENALLIEAIEDEEAVVQQGLAHLAALCADPAAVARLQDAAYNYAAAHFRREDFIRKYQTFFSAHEEDLAESLKGL